MAQFRGTRSPRSFARSQRRQTSWELGPGGAAVTTVNVSGVSFLNSVIAPNVAGLTMIRIRGEFNWALQTAAAQGDGFQGAFGIGIATTAAVTAGIASVPTPITEMGAENWLYHRIISIHAGGIIAQGVSADEDQVNSTWAAQRFEVDTKAMRKFDDEMSIYAAFEVTEIGTAEADIFFDSRSLVKLP